MSKLHRSHLETGPVMRSAGTQHDRSGNVMLCWRDVENTEEENKRERISFDKIDREETETDTHLKTGFFTNHKAIFQPVNSSLGWGYCVLAPTESFVAVIKTLKSKNK